MSKLLGIDTGGTYTDAVLFDEADGVVASAKALTTKHDLAIGIRAAAEAVLAQADGEIGLVSLSTTLATNAMVEGQGGRVCLLLIGYAPEALDRASLRDAVGQVAAASGLPRREVYARALALSEGGPRRRP